VPSIGRPRTKAETAQFFGKSTRWVELRVKAGELRRVKVGRYVSFPDEYIEEFLASHTVRADAPPAEPARNPKYAARGTAA
jgi:predicted DNA-binding transcriptional regulator AlpA